MFYNWLGPEKSQGVHLAVMDMWKPFRTVTRERAPKATIFSSMSCGHLGEARKSEYARLSGREWRR
jgi:transposase